MPSGEAPAQGLSPARAPHELGEPMRAIGSSMFPFVPAGSMLQLAELTGAEIRVGDILVFVGAAGMVAHRVVAVEAGAAGPCLLMRGDAQPSAERVPRAALAYRVVRVSFRGLSYATSGPLGRALSQLAVARGPVFRGLAWAAMQLAVVHRQALKLRAQSR